MRRLPPLGAVRAFEAAARHLSFAKAAEELGLTPTAVSHQIRGLEAELGRPLFRRRPRPLALTADGEVLRVAAESALGELARAWRGLRQDATTRVTIGVTRALADRWLIPRLSRLEADCGVCPVLKVGEAPADLRRGDVDLALRYRRTAPRGLSARRVLRDAFVAVAHPDLVARLGPGPVLERVRLIHVDWAEPRLELPTWHDYARALRDRDGVLLDPDQGLLLEESQALAAILAGQGAMLASTVMIQDALRQNALVQLHPLTLRGADLFATWLPATPVSERAEALAMWFEAEMKRRPSGS